MDIGILEDIGFTKREAKTYMALLGLGPSTTGAIVKKTEIPSSKIYEVLDRLIAKGLVSYVTKKHQKHFQAADPEAVLNYFNDRKKRFEEALPKLKEAQAMAGEHQVVELYEGKQAVIKLIHNLVDSAKKGDEYLSFSHLEEHLEPDINKFYSNLTLRRVAKGMDIKVLINEKLSMRWPDIYSKKVCEAIKLHSTPFTYPQGIVIIKDTLITMSWGENPTAVVMKSKHIVEQYRKFFYQLYDNSKKAY